jgi:hypothetical protein
MVSSNTHEPLLTEHEYYQRPHITDSYVISRMNDYLIIIIICYYHMNIYIYGYSL